VNRRASPLDPLRRERPEAGTAAARLGEVVRALPDPAALDEVAHARILRRLRDGRAAPEAWRRRPLRPVVALAALVCLVALGIGAQAAVSWMRRPGGWFADPPRSAPVAAAGSRHAPARSREAPAIAPALEAALAPDPDPPAPPATRRARVEARAPAAARDPGPSALAQESRLLARALDQLRTRRDYPGVLSTLDEYDARFPAGALRSEATLARLDALVAMGKSSAALQLLDQTTIRGPRALELLVLRGELRAAAGHHAEAVQDFDRVLARNPPGPLRRRALYGREEYRRR
jgi:tetratricopeptide (TPR) repeat protein